MFVDVITVITLYKLYRYCNRFKIAMEDLKPLLISSVSRVQGNKFLI